MAVMVPADSRAAALNIPTSLSVVTNATITATDAAALTIPKGRDIGVLVLQSAANNGTSNTVYGLDVQVGTNWSTTAPIRMTAAMNGTNTTGVYFWLGATNFAGVNAVRLGYLSTTQTNAVTPASITLDWTN